MKVPKAADLPRKGALAIHPYRDQEGRLHYVRGRFGENPKVQPFHWNGRNWEYGEPEFQGRKPLYGLEQLAKLDDETTVYWAEGEKCIDQLRNLGLIAVTSGSANSESGADLRPLAGRSVRIWPDHDEPGQKHAQRVKKALERLACKVSVIEVEVLGLPDHGDVCDWHMDRIERDQETTLNDVLSLPVVGDKSLRLVTTEELLTTDWGDPEWLIEGLLEAGGSLMIHGRAGVGKTWIAQSMAMALGSGQAFMKWGVPEPVACLYLDAELSLLQLQVRVAKLTGGITPRVNWLNAQQCGGVLPDVGTPGGQAAIEGLITDERVLFVDNLAAMARQGDENSPESWRPIANWLNRLRSRGIAPVLVHHSGKGGAQRGTSDREALFDVILEAVASPNAEDTRLTLRFNKARHLGAQERQPITIRLNTSVPVYSWEVIEDVYQHEIEALHEQGRSQAEIAAQLGISQSTVSRRLRAS